MAVGRVSPVVTYVEAGVGEEALLGGARLPWTRPARVGLLVGRREGPTKLSLQGIPARVTGPGRRGLLGRPVPRHECLPLGGEEVFRPGVRRPKAETMRGSGGHGSCHLVDEELVVSVPTMAECRVGGDVFLDGPVDATVPVPAGRDGSRQWDVHRAGGSLVSRLRGTRVVDGCLERSRQQVERVVFGRGVEVAACQPRCMPKGGHVLAEVVVVFTLASKGEAGAAVDRHEVHSLNSDVEPFAMWSRSAAALRGRDGRANCNGHPAVGEVGAI